MDTILCSVMPGFGPAAEVLFPGKKDRNTTQWGKQEKGEVEKKSG